MIIAAWGSLFLHAAVLTGAGLAFPKEKEAFPKPAPRKITILSIGRSKAVPEKEEIKKTVSQKIEKPTQKPVVTQKESSAVSRNSQPEKNTNPQTEATGDNEHAESNTVIKPEEFRFNTIDTSPVIKEPAPLTPIEPDYPFKARKRGFEGTVRMAVCIDKAGRPISCTILKTSGYYDLDQTAEKTVMQTSFSPKTIDGKKTEGTLEITILFKLKD
ncbi:MAG: hypothetical protein DRP59_03760 [Spirochaetes bacterium]|nr:MAG: hypothetical protein DRP59_03760 [Spirochaetota bacterium]